MSNHGEMGKALYLKYSPEKFKEMTGDLLEHGYTVSMEEFNSKYGDVLIPIHIDKNTKGNYECVCEYGTEVY